MKKTIRLKFIDCWKGHNPERDLYFKLLSKNYNVILSDHPDYVIDEGFGHEYVDHNYDECIKLISIGENIIPDFNSFDYAVGFEYLSFGDRYLRMPLFVFYDEFRKLSERVFLDDEKLLRRGFCSFVVSNPDGDPMRTEFFHELSKYKTIASGGRYLNNVGGPVIDKASFCSKFKFNIAFENSVSLGYTTEKVMQPYTVNSVPIYYGNPFVGQDFNVESMVLVTSRHDIRRAIEEIVYLDTHDDAYLDRLKMPCLINSVDWYEDRLMVFLKNIFDKPVEKARRIVPYGFQCAYRARLHNLYKVDDLWKKPFRIVNKVKNNIQKLI